MLYEIKVCWVYSESPQRGNSHLAILMSIHNIPFRDKIRKSSPKYILKEFPRDLKNEFKSVLVTLSSGFELLSYTIFWKPWWLSWMRRPTGDQEVTGSTPAEVDNILSWSLIVKYFLRSFSPFRWFKKGSCQFLAKECAQYWLTA